MKYNKSILLVSNMYPSCKFPFLGTFVKNSEKMIKDENITIDRVVIDRRSNNVIDKLFMYMFFYFKVLIKLFSGDYEYVYAHYASHVALPLVIYRVFNKKVKIIIHAHGGDIKQLSGTSSIFFKIKKLFSNAILTRAYKVIVPSYSYESFLLKEFVSVSRDDVIIYPSGGVDCLLFNYDQSCRDLFKIGFAGRLIKSKNVELVIKALPYLENYTLDIVGDGIEKDFLVDLAESLELNGRVKFYPAKSPIELSDWYKSISFLVYPSSSESLGLVPIEAMSCGALTILSDIPAFRELADNGLCVNFMGNFSEDAIVSSIKKIKPFDDMRIKNSGIVQQVYSSEKVRRDLINVFK